MFEEYCCVAIISLAFCLSQIICLCERAIDIASPASQAAAGGAERKDVKAPAQTADAVGDGKLTTEELKGVHEVGITGGTSDGGGLPVRL